MKRTVPICCLLLLQLGLLAQQQVMPLYAGDIPCPTEQTYTEEVRPDIGLLITDVQHPELHHFAPVPWVDNQTAVLVIPGGGYMIEAWDLEGVDIARYLSHRGYHAFVLRHRLPGRIDADCKSEVALTDAQEGMLTVRSVADSLGIQRVGIMGFSAGGHLAGSTSIYHREAGEHSSRPDFSVLVYPVTILGEEGVTNMGSQYSLLGKNPDPELIAHYHLPERIDSTTPPTLLIHSADDEAVVVENSLRYFSRLRTAGVSAALQVYPTGGHGFGSARQLDGAVNTWLEQVDRWIKALP